MSWRGWARKILVAQTAFLLARGRASILAPTYSEHARVAELAGHNVVEVADVTQLVESRIAVVVNPNNPDGRIVSKDALDEAFMDVGPWREPRRPGRARHIVVLRSFGKFYGLPGLGLSFVIASQEVAARIATALGPWPIAGAALAIGNTAWSTWRGARRRAGRSPRRRQGSMGCSPSLGLR
jgi:cobalamin biosynthetic protein CobC